MATELFDTTAAKKSTNLSINGDLLRKAKERNINLSQTLEMRLAELLREEQIRRWLEDNREAIEEYNRHIEGNGAFSDGLRHF